MTTKQYFVKQNSITNLFVGCTLNHIQFNWFQSPAMNLSFGTGKRDAVDRRHLGQAAINKLIPPQQLNVVTSTHQHVMQYGIQLHQAVTKAQLSCESSYWSTHNRANA